MAALVGPALALAAFVIGAVASMCGIGGGLFAVPLLHFAFKLPLRSSVATALCLVCATAASATVTEALRPDSALRFSLVAALVAGSLLGAQLGHRVASRLSTRKLQVVFAAVLLVAAYRLLFAGGAGPSATAEFAPSAGLYATTAVIGLGAGFVVPLLGVGGGLVVVPALLFAAPEIGYLGARASSLGMATVTSARSLFLYRDSGLVRKREGLWFALGALAGAVAGVQWVHAAGNSEIARQVLGGVLCLSGARFGWNALAPGKREGEAD